MKLQVGLLVLWASTAMAACQPGTVPGPYTAQNVDFDVICGKGLSGTSYSTQASNQAGYIEMCMVACAVDSSCIGIVWDNIGMCTLFSSVSGLYDDYTDVAIRRQPTTSTSAPSSTTSSESITTSAASSFAPSASSTSSSASTTSSAAVGACSDGLVISNGAQLLVQCGSTITTGSAYNTPSSANEGDCWDSCVNDLSDSYG
ncbi:hypothetical protein FANTH_8268 [Fusarium anthophilum]|uniref:Apple domain-containing protein n=1 Tax=Fusarium anthophilum TaxID=48485 RepID=A0A8H5E0Z9_9HYPO|nr:hypothetical protein FANTH_8268 [Fusarium anthophilum]